jgi:hypothetical protein
MDTKSSELYEEGQSDPCGLSEDLSKMDLKSSSLKKISDSIGSGENPSKLDLKSSSLRELSDSELNKFSETIELFLKEDSIEIIAVRKMLHLCKNIKITKKVIDIVLSKKMGEFNKHDFIVFMRENVSLTDDEAINIISAFKDISIKSTVAITLFSNKKVSIETLLKIKNLFFCTDIHFLTMLAFADKMEKIHERLLRFLFAEMNDCQREIYCDTLIKYNLIIWREE